MLFSLLFLPVSWACTKPPVNMPQVWDYWTSKCTLTDFCDPANLPQNMMTHCQTSEIPNTCLWVGVQVDLFQTTSPTQCQGAIQIPLQEFNVQQIEITQIKILWTCHNPEYYKPVLRPDGTAVDFGFRAAVNPADATPIITAVNNLQDFAQFASTSKLLPFIGNPITIPGGLVPPDNVAYPLSPPMTCASGWKLKLWFYLCGGQMCPGNFPIRIAAGAIGGSPHAIKSITPTRNFVQALGDVHFLTLDSVRYTFNAAGDYIYSRTKKPDFEVQVRTTMAKRGSVLAAIGVRDYINDDVIELWWNGTSADTLIANGRNRKGFIAGTQIDPSVQHVLKFESDGNGVEKEARFGDFELIHDEASKTISVTNKRWGKEFVLQGRYGGKASFAMNVPDEWDLEGLAGNKNGVKFDDLCYRNQVRDGCLSLKASSAEVHSFGLSWKANPHEQLFQRWMSVSEKDLIFKPLEYTEEELIKAGKFCGADKACLYDYLSTEGDEEFAKHTRDDSFSRAFGEITHVGDDFH